MLSQRDAQEDAHLPPLRFVLICHVDAFMNLLQDGNMFKLVFFASCSKHYPGKTCEWRTVEGVDRRGMH